MSRKLAIPFLFAVVVSSALAQAIRDPAEGQPGQPVPLFGTAVAGKDGTGKLQSIAVDPTGIVSVSSNNSDFNGATWEPVYANWHTTTGDTGTKTVTFNGITQTNFNARGALVTVILGTVSGTTPTLACQLQWSPDAGTTWITYGPALANLTASSQTGTIMVYPTVWQQALQNAGTPAGLATGSTVSLALNAPLPRTWRLLHTIGGTTPSFAITSEHIEYLR